MSRQQNPTITAEDANVHKESETQLHGRWLRIARVSWIALTLLILILNVVMLPRYATLLQAHCSLGPHCYALQWTTYDRQLLHQFGLSPDVLISFQIILNGGSVMVCCALGTLIFWRKSANLMALFCAFMLVLFGGTSFTSILQNALASISPAWFAVVGTLDLLGQSSFMIFFFLFPNGRFVPRWTRWLVPCVVLYWIVAIFFNDLSIESLWSALVFIALLLCIVGSQVYRYRYMSTSHDRQQTKWVVFGFSIGIIGFVLVLVIGNMVLPPSLSQSGVTQALASTTIYGFLLLIPLSIAIAILRSRLWDIDRLINRALVYGTLTTSLILIYLGSILLLQLLLQFLLNGFTAGRSLAIVASTLGIAALFQPLRHRIQTVIDSRFYRSKYDAARTVEAFSVTLRNEVDLDQLRDSLLNVVRETPGGYVYLHSPLAVKCPLSED